MPDERGTFRAISAGRCPNGGGDARRRRKSERGSFSASLLSRKTPRSVLGGFADRVAPVPTEKPLGNAKHNANAAAPRGNGNSAAKLGLFSHKPLGAGVVVVEPLLGRDSKPKTPRPMGQRPSRDEYGDDSRTKPHRARG